MRQFWPCASKLGASLQEQVLNSINQVFCSFSNAPVCWTAAGLTQWIKAGKGGCQVTSIDFWSAHFATRTTKTKGRKVKSESESQEGGASQLWAM